MAGGSLATHATAIFSAIYWSLSVIAAIGNSIGMAKPYIMQTKQTLSASEYLKWIMYSEPPLKYLYHASVVDLVT